MKSKLKKQLRPKYSNTQRFLNFSVSIKIPEKKGQMKIDEVNGTQLQQSGLKGEKPQEEKEGQNEKYCADRRDVITE